MPKILNNLKESLLFQTHRILEQSGYSSVTIRAVASSCGVGVGTVYNYFPSKEAMIAEYILEDWRSYLVNMEAVSCRAESAQVVAQTIYDGLVRFADSHKSIFLDETAAASFAGAFSQYHGLLRSQLAAPLRPWCRSDFAADFAAEALLTWSMNGKEFCDIWELLASSVKEK